jgi:hypothetical protein
MTAKLNAILERIETLKSLRDSANLALRLKDVRFYEGKLAEMYAEKLAIETEVYTRWGFSY